VIAPAVAPPPASLHVVAPRLRGVRGATTVEADTPAHVDAAVAELLEALAARNGIGPDDVVSAIFSTTADLRTRPPAASARAIGWTDVPMLCVAEMEVAEPLARCVRVLLHVAVTDGRALRPVYLHDARSLRPDLVGDAR
jgi:chorismate mutase